MTKVISLSDEAYKRLSNLKTGKDSFSDVVIKVTDSQTKKSILDLAGAWEQEKEESRKIFKEIIKERKKAKMREVEL